MRVAPRCICQRSQHGHMAIFLLRLCIKGCEEIQAWSFAALEVECVALTSSAFVGASIRLQTIWIACNFKTGIACTQFVGPAQTVTTLAGHEVQGSNVQLCTEPRRTCGNRPSLWHTRAQALGDADQSRVDFRSNGVSVAPGPRTGGASMTGPCETLKHWCTECLLLLTHGP